MDLFALLTRPEGKTLEFKRDLSSPGGFLRTVTAFANTAGGTILIGVEDGTRQVRGIEDPLAQEERVANLISDSISPRLLPDIELLSYGATHVLAVRVYPSPARPHHLGREEAAGTFVRVGSTNRRADADLIEEMGRFVRRESFDERPLPEVGAEALDFEAAATSFSGFRELREADLDVLGLRTTHQGRQVATVGGMLLFGRNRLGRFPDAWIQAGRFAGSDKARILNQARLEMLLPEAVAAAVTFVERHTAGGLEIGRVRSRPRHALPPPALREAIVNAVVHTDYSQRGAPIQVAVFDDRVEVENPGLLPFGLALEDLPRGVSRLRNRVIGSVFRELRLVEQWGSGAPRMISACREAGLGPPVWEEIGMRLRVTLPLERRSAPRADPVDQAILDLLEAGGQATREVAEAIGRSTRATRTRLARLVERGLVAVHGNGPQDPKRRYRLT